MSIADRLGEIYDDAADQYPDLDALKFAHEVVTRLSPEEQELALHHVAQKLLYPLLRAAKSKTTEGKEVHPSTQAVASIQPPPVKRVQKTKGAAVKYSVADALRFAIVNGIPLLEHTTETLEAAMAVNAAKAQGYLQKNEKISKIQAVVISSGVERVCDVPDLNAIQEIWTGQ